MPYLLSHVRFSHERLRPTAHRRVAITVTVALGPVAGCGSDSTDESTATAPTSDAEVSLPTSLEPSPSSPSSPSTGPLAADAFPVTVEHAYGSTESPSQPTQVVSVGYNDRDSILAVSIVPVSMMPWYNDYPVGFFWSSERYVDDLPETVDDDEFPR